MNSQDFRALQEAYLEVVSNQLDERVLGQDPESRKEDSKERKSGSKRLSPYSGEKYAKTQSQHISYMDKLTKNKKIIPGMANEEFDEQVELYDIILSHLLDEGYADTIENAESIMVNMSEDWRDSIFEELTGERKKMALEKGGYLAKRVASGKEGQPLERRNRSGDITMSTTMKGPTNRGGGGIKGRIKSDLYGNDETHGGGNKSRRRRGMKVTDTSDEL